jgi:chloramphenicol-sensitive protein RarD
LNGSSQLDLRSGLVYAVAAYGLWGLMPLYFRAVAEVPALELLAQRILWSVVLLAGVLVSVGRWGELVRCLRAPRTRWLLLASALLIAANWLVYIHCVTIKQVVQASLGYFINPLLNVLLGVLFFRERLRPVQWLALALAGAGLVYLVGSLGEGPWLALVLAGSFAAYGVLRKVAPVDTLVGVTAETLLLLPAAVTALGWWAWQGQLSLGAQGWTVDGLLLASGAVTAGPLLCFGQAVRRLPLSLLGFLQYLAPSLQLLLAVLVLGEPFGRAKQVSFGLIWAALVLLSLQVLLARRAAAT